MCVLSHSVVFDYCDPKDCSLAGSSVHGILQARIMEWVAVSFSRRSSQPRNRTQVSCIADSLLTELRGQFLCKNQILEPPEDVTETAVGITLGLAVTHLFWFLLAFGKHHIVHLINPCTSDLSSMPQRELLRACILPEIALACTHTFKSLE